MLYCLLLRSVKIQNPQQPKHFQLQQRQHHHRDGLIGRLQKPDVADRHLQRHVDLRRFEVPRRRQRFDGDERDAAETVRRRRISISASLDFASQRHRSDRIFQRLDKPRDLGPLGEPLDAIRRQWRHRRHTQSKDIDPVQLFGLGADPPGQLQLSHRQTARTSSQPRKLSPRWQPAPSVHLSLVLAISTELAPRLHKPVPQARHWPGSFRRLPIFSGAQRYWVVRDLVDVRLLVAAAEQVQLEPGPGAEVPGWLAAAKCLPSQFDDGQRRVVFQRRRSLPARERNQPLRPQPHARLVLVWPLHWGRRERHLRRCWSLDGLRNNWRTAGSRLEHRPAWLPVRQRSGVRVLGVPHQRSVPLDEQDHCRRYLSSKRSNSSQRLRTGLKLRITLF